MQWILIYEFSVDFLILLLWKFFLTPMMRIVLRCAMFLVAFGFLIVVFELTYFISTMLQAMFIVEELKMFFIGAAMLLLGLLIFRCNIGIGAYSSIYREKLIPQKKRMTRSLTGRVTHAQDYSINSKSSLLASSISGILLHNSPLLFIIHQILSLNCLLI